MIWTPTLFGVSFILTFFAQNNGQLYLKALPIPFILTIVLGLVILKTSVFLLKDQKKGVVFASIFMIAFFSFGQLVVLLEKVLSPADVLLFSLESFLLFLVFVKIKRTPVNLGPAVKFLTVMSVISICLPIILIVGFEFSQKLRPPIASPTPLPTSPATLNQSKLPDIYYIVPEDYSAPIVMQNFFQADNRDFLGFLADRGFYYASESASNYPKSFLSLASTMNMEYLDYLSVFKNSSDLSLVDPLIQNSKVLQFLRLKGYAFYQMGSWWGPTKYNFYADKNFIAENQHLVAIDEFTYSVLQSTMLRPFVDKLIPPVVITDSDAGKRARILYQFSALPEVISLPSPKFVFMHIIAPHDPWVFDKDCRFIDAKVFSKFTEEQNYANQAACLNEKLENAISQILDQSAKPPVILLQSDEGAPFLGRRMNDNWKTASVDLLKEKFPTLAMYYLPGISAEKAGLYPGITPVNSFRVILNAYFKTKLPLLPDKEYIFPDPNHLYQFQDVSEMLK